MQALNNIGSVFRISDHIRFSLEHYLMAFAVVEEANSSFVTDAEDTAATSGIELYTIGMISVIMVAVEVAVAIW